MNVDIHFASGHYVGPAEMVEDPQRALDDAQTAALVGDDVYMLRILLSALAHIASGGKVYAKQWEGLRKER